jgi:hypothetical protein
MDDKGKRAFKTTDKASIPTGRVGKHRSIVARILGDLEGLNSNEALKIPLSGLPDTKVNIRSAIKRGALKHGKSVGTAADENYLYVWNI